MTVAETLSVDGYLFTSGATRQIETRAGLYRTTPMRGSDTSVYGRHGVLPGSRRRRDTGGFTASIWWWGVDRDSAERQFEQLLRAASPTHRLATWVRGLGDGTPRSCAGRVVDAVEPEDLSLGQGFRARLAVQVPAGCWTDTTDTTDATPAGVVLPADLLLTSKARATLEMGDLRYLIVGPVTNPQVLVTGDLAPGQSFTWAGTVPAGCTLTVDTGTWTVTGAGSSGGTPFVPSLDLLSWTGDRILEVPPAAPGQICPSVRLLGSQAGAGTQLSIVGRASFLT